MEDKKQSKEEQIYSLEKTDGIKKIDENQWTLPLKPVTDRTCDLIITLPPNFPHDTPKLQLKCDLTLSHNFVNERDS